MAAAGVKAAFQTDMSTHTRARAPESEPASLRPQAHLTESPPAFDSRQRMT